MEKKVIYEKIENKYIDDLSVEDIYFVSFAEGGAMGDGGAVCLISLEDDNIIIRSGNYVYGDLDINKLSDKFPPLEKIYSKDKFKDWSYEYMGAGNHYFYHLKK